jgi:hypothetical protein
MRRRWGLRSHGLPRVPPRGTPGGQRFGSTRGRRGRAQNASTSLQRPNPTVLAREWAGRVAGREAPAALLGARSRLTVPFCAQLTRIVPESA